MSVDLRHGDWRVALADVGAVEAVITDCPYGARTHTGNDDIDAKTDGAARRSISYAHWTPADVAEFVAAWSPRCTGWMCAMTSDDLIPAWRASYAAAGRFDFAPVTIVAPRVRLVGDGPASATVYLMVSRPRAKRFMSWGALPGWYEAGIERDGHIGGKPLGLMRALVRDYSRPSDLVCDPCAGRGTTLRAAVIEGRRAVGSEIDRETYAMARRYVDAAHTPDLFATLSPQQKDPAA